MSDISVEINNDADKIDVDKIDVDKNDDKVFTFDNELHNGKPITMIEISPNENYLITYSKKDHSIVGWNVEDKDKLQLKFDQTVKINKDYRHNRHEITNLCVSDDKKLAYIYSNNIIIIDMDNKDKKIALSFDRKVYPYYCTFNLKGEFILYGEVSFVEKRKIIWIYSTQTKNNKWECKRFYEIPKDYEIISISKYDKVYLFSNVSNDYICEWNINTEKSVKIFDNNTIIIRNIGIFSNEKFNILNVCDKIIVYSIELGIPIASLNINDDTQFYNFMNHTGLFLLPSLFFYTPDKKIIYCWNSKYKDGLNQTLLTDEQIEFVLNLGFNETLFSEPTDAPTDVQTKLVFGILNERVWKSKFYENMSKTKVIECDDDDKKIYNHLNVHSINPYMDIVSTLFQKAIGCINTKYLTESIENLIEWNIYDCYDKIALKVFKKINTEWKLISSRIENYPYNRSYNKHVLIVSSLFNNNDIVILTTFGILIYTFNENNKSISLNYFYFMHLGYSYSNKDKYMEILQHNTRIFSKSTLPLPNYDSFRLNGWVSDAKNNKSSLLKYGVELLTFAIKEHKLELIDDIYKKCMTYFKENPMNNKSFLSIITSAMPLLDKYYPEFILKYSSETNMIIDSSFYSIKQQNKNLHLYSFFQPPQIANLSKSLLWTKYHYNLPEAKKTNLLKFILLIIYYAIQALIILLTLPLYFATFYFLSKHNFINNIYASDVFSFAYFHAVEKVRKFRKHIKVITTTPTITFMIPYVNFVNYSKDYNWFLELIRPQPSPFTKLINRNIYKTWNGEALINFKWNAYGKYYYAMIWILFMTLLGCFTAAATIPQKYINEEARQQLFISSIILGFIHLIFEIRQFFYNITMWFYNFWNIFDIIAYFLLFFRAFEYFGVYFAIIISVGKKIFSFLIVIFIIIISFAHAFYILLSPKSEFSFEQHTNNDDPNNPWNLAPSYSQVIDNDENINSNPFTMIQSPDKNTNMFIDIRTSLFAIYLFLAGDSSALSNWSYADNPSIAILIVLFSLLVVVYLMNLLIGLLNNAIEEDNNRVSYLLQKAEILAEIELFYLLPHQRRWQTWFPEVIHYYADADKTRIEIERLIKEGEWDNKEFIKMQEKLLEQLQIKHNPNDNKVILEKVKSNDEKLDKLEKLEKSHCEILEKLGKLETLEKSHCEILDKLEKLLERNAC
ncbi:unnamed protein product [Rhizophagus irregularis]|nr:unnamed protein product [Rhizophagus irregularis]